MCITGRKYKIKSRYQELFSSCFPELKGVVDYGMVLEHTETFEKEGGTFITLYKCRLTDGALPAISLILSSELVNDLFEPDNSIIHCI